MFNIGSQDLPLGEIGVKVNDNNYHVVRFTRNGGNATLQIDDYNVQSLHAQGISVSNDFKEKITEFLQKQATFQLYSTR